MNTQYLIELFHKWRTAIVENESVVFAEEEISGEVLKKKFGVLIEILLNRGVALI